MVKGYTDEKGRFRVIGKSTSNQSHDSSKKTEGVRLRREFSNPEIQSLIFPKNKFSESEARRWAKSHGFKAPKTDMTKNSIRIRQLSPSKIKSGDTCRTIPLGSDVKAVLCDVRMARDTMMHPKLERQKEQEGKIVKYWTEDFDQGFTASMVEGDFPDEMEIRISTPDDRFSVRGHKSIMDKWTYDEFEKKVLQHIERHEMMKKK